MAMATEISIEHRYPQVLDFVRRFGPNALVVLDDLVSNAKWCDGSLLVETSVREISERLQVLSKDTVHRRMTQLSRAEVICRLLSTDPFQPSKYIIDLTDTGISVTTSPPHSKPTSPIHRHRPRDGTQDSLTVVEESRTSEATEGSDTDSHRATLPTNHPRRLR